MSFSLRRTLLASEFGVAAAVRIRRRGASPGYAGTRRGRRRDRASGDHGDSAQPDRAAKARSFAQTRPRTPHRRRTQSRAGTAAATNACSRHPPNKACFPS